MNMIGTGLRGSVTEIRMFLKADSADELVRLQLNNNIKFASHSSYTDFSQSPVDKKWYCWYLIDISRFPTEIFGNIQTGQKETEAMIDAATKKSV